MKKTHQIEIEVSKTTKNMEKENIETTDSPKGEAVNEPEEVVEPEIGLPADPVEVEPKDDVEDEAEILKERNQQLYEQLKKAKGFIRDKGGKWVKKEEVITPKKVEGADDITKTELYSLVKADVPDEDVNEVVIYARSHDITATEALKLPEVQSILQVRA